MIPIQQLPIKEVIDSLNHPLANYLRGFFRQEDKLTQQEMIIDDMENISEALKAGITLTALFLSGTTLELPKAWVDTLPEGLPFYEIAPRTCKKLFDKDRMSRVFAVGRLPSCTDLSVLANTTTDVVVLEGLAISGNIGAIIRTSTALNASAMVIINSHPVDIYDRRVIRASRGYIFRLPILSLSIQELLLACKQYHLTLLATSAQAKETIDIIAARKERMAIIFGAEKEGFSDELSKQASLAMRITMNPHVESLNVSVAASIVLYMRDYFKRSYSQQDEPAQ